MTVRRISDLLLEELVDLAGGRLDDSPTAESTVETLRLGAAALVADRYEILEEIGRGASAVVHRARDRHAGGEHVALKTFVAPSELERARIRRELEITQALRHPAVVRCLGFGRLSDDVVFIAMEWLEGSTLRAALATRPLTVEETLALARRISGALGAAHAAGIVHRDVKPTNVFLVGGDPSRAVLLDFGLARRTVADHALTATGTFLGTPGYAAPEQIRSTRRAGPPADVFSLGAVLHEALSGRRTFAADDLRRVVVDSMTSEAPPLPRHCPPALASLVEAMLDKEPGRRPPHGAAVSDALRRIAPDGPGADVVPATSDELVVGPAIAEDDLAVDHAASLGGAPCRARVYRGHVLAERRRADAIAAAARDAAGLAHPGALTPWRVVFGDDVLVVIAGAPHGQPLDALLADARASGLAAPASAIAWTAVAVLEVIASAHELSPAVVHGRLEARDVVVGPAGGIAVGGFVRRAEGPAASTAWSAPEHELLAGRLLGPATDVFDVGALALRALHPGVANLRVARAAAREGGHVSTALRRATDKDPRRRGTARELQRALAASADGAAWAWLVRTLASAPRSADAT